MIKEISIIAFFYLLTLFQDSFLNQYLKGGSFISIVLVFIVVFSFLQKKESQTGLVATLSGGFFLDIFSPYFFGLFTLISLSAFLLIKFLRSFFDSNKFVSFSVISLAVFLFYEIVLSLLNLANGFHFSIYNFLFNFLSGLIVYLLLKVSYVFVQKRFKK